MFILALALAVEALCPVEKAHYSLRHQTDVTLSFRPVAASRDWPAGIAADVHFQGTGRSYYFLPWNGGTDGLQNMAYTTDVTQPGFTLPSPDGGPGRRGDIQYIGTDTAYNIIDHAPQKGDPAPGHILMAQLGDLTRHSDFEVRDAPEKQFFDLDGCGAK